MRRLFMTLAAATVLAPCVATAQLIPNNNGQVGPARATPLTNNRPPPAPPALPGAQSTGPVVDAQRAARDLSPNDQLFDAIDRGDIAAARDALSRGASLHARNALGETPIALSVDLARNDITFLLLSSRDGEPTPGARPPAANPIRNVAANPVVAHAAPAPVSVPRATAPVPSRPQPMSNDPGVPDAAAGFLGFGAVQR